MKIYLDDERTAPEGWIRCYWPHEVISLYKMYGSQIEHISLDHDLGNDEIGTGRTFLEWLEEQMFHDANTHLPELTVHSQNPEGRKYMCMIIESIKRLKYRKV